MFEPWEMMAVDRAGCNGITNEHIQDAANAFLDAGKAEIPPKNL